MRRIGARLVVQYSALFLAAGILILGTSYVLVADSLRRQDHSVIGFRLNEFFAQYRVGGLDLLRQEVRAEREISTGAPFMLRVASADDRTLLLDAPRDWQPLPGSLVAGIPVAPEPSTIRTAARDYEMRAIRTDTVDIIQVAISTEGRKATLRHLGQVVALISLPLLIVSVLAGFAITLRSLRPIARLSSAIRTIVTTGRVDERLLPHGARNELLDLTELFNKMLARIELLIDRMRTVLDEVAHDLRTPLSRMRGRLELALQSGHEPDLRQAVASSLDEMDSIQDLFDSILDLTAAESGTMLLRPSTVPLRDVIVSAVDLYEHVAVERGIQLRMRVSEDLTVHADVERMRQVLANLIDNALKYTSRGGEVTVAGVDSLSHVSILVRDSGEGIRGVDLDRIWDRLYRGANAKGTGGVGLGLSFVKAVVLAHGGTIGVESDSAGSVFRIELPPHA
jgi:signal transduction histidine kinase